MTPRKTNIILRIAALSTGAAAVVVIIAGMGLPVQLPASDGKRPAAASSFHAEPAMAALPPLEGFSGIWAHRLRRPLEESASRAETPKTPDPAPAGTVASLPITLVGTIGTSLAILRMPDGSTVVKAVGEQIDGAEVLVVRFAAVEIRLGGRTVTLEKPANTGNGFIVFSGAEDPSHEIDSAAH
jgi:hypothetical protein